MVSFQKKKGKKKTFFFFLALSHVASGQSDPSEVAAGFAQHYYGQFDADRSQLGALYGPDSMLTFEDKQVQGADQIVAVLVALAFQTVRHQIKTVDAQPTVGNGIIVFVSGDLFVDGELNPIK